jgi:hypothetical protein
MRGVVWRIITQLCWRTSTRKSIVQSKILPRIRPLTTTSTNPTLFSARFIDDWWLNWTARRINLVIYIYLLARHNSQNLHTHTKSRRFFCSGDWRLTKSNRDHVLAHGPFSGQGAVYLRGQVRRKRRFRFLWYHDMSSCAQRFGYARPRNTATAYAGIDSIICTHLNHHIPRFISEIPYRCMILHVLYSGI